MHAGFRTTFESSPAKLKKSNQIRQMRVGWGSHTLVMLCEVKLKRIMARGTLLLFQVAYFRLHRGMQISINPLKLYTRTSHE